MKHPKLNVLQLGLAALFAFIPLGQSIAQEVNAPVSIYDSRGLLHDPDPNEPSEALETSQAMRLVGPSTTAPVQPRMVAEWEPVQAALIRYPLGIPMDAVKLIASELKINVLCNAADQDAARAAFQKGGVNMSNIAFVTAPTDTYWTRDYAPVWITNLENGKREVRMLDLICRLNGLRPNDDRVPSVLATAFNMPTYFGVNFVCQGGNVMTDGFHGGVSSDRVQDENPTLSLSQIKQGCLTYAGINPYYMMMGPVFPGEHSNHMDCWAKFIAPNKVLVKRVPPSDIHYARFEEAANTWANQTDAAGHPYQVIRVDGSYDSPYVNHVILNDRVLVPILTSETDPADKTALDQIKAAYGNSYRVIGVKAASGLPWLATDAIHCRVSAIPVFSGLSDQNVGLTLTNLPSSMTVKEGATAGFHVAVAGGTMPYNYQWYKNNSPVSGATRGGYAFTTQAADNNAAIHVVVTDSSSPVKTITSNNATLTVDLSLIITTPLASKTVAVGSPVTFAVAASGGTTPYSYQWYKNKIPVTGATGASLTFTTQSTDNKAAIYVVVSDSSSPVKTVASSIVTLTVTPALCITTQPASKTVAAGNPVTFTVAASGGITPYTYQWFKNNAAVSGATGASYTFTTQATDNNAAIYVVVSDSSSPVKTVASSIVILTVNPALSITTQPASKTAATGSTVAFTVAASGGIKPYTYQWFKNTTAISGATKPTYEFIAQATDNNTTFHVVVSDSSSPVKTVTSSNATLTVNPALSITTQPASKTVAAGTPVTFTVAASGGTTPYTYRWFKNNAAVNGATGASYTFTAKVADNAATLHVVVSDSSSPVKTVTSSKATLTVNPAFSITNQPDSTTVAVGSPVTFTVAASGGITPYTYQWFKNNAAVSGATTASYTFTTQATDNNAAIYVVVSDSSSPVKTVTSSNAILTVNPALSITTQPASKTVAAGSTVAFTVAASGGIKPYTYQWFKNTTAISGATKPVYEFIAQATDNNATFHVVVSDSASPVKTVTSSNATLTVNPALSITTQPASKTVAAGTPVTFTVAASGGTTPYTYQWFKNKAAVSGATSASYTFTAHAADNNASIHVVVSDSSSPVKTVASSIVTLTVNPAFSITTQPASKTVAAGSPVTFTVAASGGITPYTYQWFKNNAALSGATGASYTFTTQATDNNATLYVVVSDSSSPVKTVTSSIAILTVTPVAPLSITNQPDSKTVTAGSRVGFRVEAAGGIKPYTYQWFKNNAAVSGATDATYTFIAQVADNNASIRVVVSDSSSPVKTITSSNAILTVTPTVPLIITNHPDSKTVEVGSPVKFRVEASGGITPYSYQWFKNTTAISGATKPVYEFIAQATDNNATFHVVISDSSSPVKTVASSIATLTVTPADPLIITNQPDSKTKRVGSTVMFRVNVSGGNQPYTYQWFKNNTAISGATDDQYSFTVQAADNNATFHVVVSDSSRPVKTVTSSKAILTVVTIHLNDLND